MIYIYLNNIWQSETKGIVLRNMFNGQFYKEGGGIIR